MVYAKENVPVSGPGIFPGASVDWLRRFRSETGSKQTDSGKEYTFKVSSYAAKDEATAKKMVELIRSENDSVLGKMTMDKVIDGMDDGAKVTVVSQQANIVKVKYKGAELYVFADHLKP